MLLFFRHFVRIRVAIECLKLIAMPAVSYANNSELFICVDCSPFTVAKQ